MEANLKRIEQKSLLDRVFEFLRSNHGGSNSGVSQSNNDNYGPPENDDHQ
jgi:hypothetical protein